MERRREEGRWERGREGGKGEGEGKGKEGGRKEGRKERGREGGKGEGGRRERREGEEKTSNFTEDTENKLYCCIQEPKRHTVYMHI